MIDDYLDQLADALDVEPRRARRILAETEDHLREAAAERVAAGEGSNEAERQAVARFGAVGMVAARFNGAVSPRTWFFRAYLYAALLAGIVLLAGGVTGELSAAFGLAFGKAYVSGDTAGVTYTAARCADFREYHPEATSCEQAATLHHFDEIWRNGDIALVLGILVLGTHLFLRRRFATGESDRSFPRRMFWIVGLAGFGAAGPLLLVFGAVAGVSNHWWGQVPALAGGAVALVAAAAFLAPGWRNLRAITREYAA